MGPHNSSRMMASSMGTPTLTSAVSPGWLFVSVMASRRVQSSLNLHRKGQERETHAGASTSWGGMFVKPSHALSCVPDVITT